MNIALHELSKDLASARDHRCVESYGRISVGFLLWMTYLYGWIDGTEQGTGD